MVKLGFIGEGDTEKRVLESYNFRSLLQKLKLDFVPEVVDADGGGNLYPAKLPNLIKILSDKGATHVVILTDRENFPCISKVKARIQPVENQLIIVAVKTLEAWFLADTEAISALMRSHYNCEKPEEIESPYLFIKEEMFRLTDRGITKPMLCSKMLWNNFSIESAAAHPNCFSAKYFLDKLKSLAK